MCTVQVRAGLAIQRRRRRGVLRAVRVPRARHEREWRARPLARLAAHLRHRAQQGTPPELIAEVTIGSGPTCKIHRCC